MRVAPIITLLALSITTTLPASPAPQRITTRQLPPEVIQRVIRASFGKFRRCYELGLRSCPNLQGRVNVNFTIRPNGTVSRADGKGSDLADTAVVDCVTREFKQLVFPTFEGPPIRVSYPVLFTPGS